LAQLGLLDLYEAFPRHLYGIAAQAEKRNSGYFRRLEEFRKVFENRKRFPFRGIPAIDEDITPYDLDLD